MPISRRSLLGAAVASWPARLLTAGRLGSLRVGVTDWNLGQTGNVQALAIARSLGFEGVEISLGRTPVSGRLPLDDAAVIEGYVRGAKAQGIALAGTCLDILHVNYLKSDPLAPKWVAAGIAVTAKLKARVLLLPSFGKGSVGTANERDYVADILKELCPEAERAGVVLAVENTLSAEDNARLMERSRSGAVRVFYDVGNAVKYGHEPVKEIRWLGRERIAQFHLKDHKGYIGEGPIDFRPVMTAIAEIEFAGFADLETDSPTGVIADDMARNQKAVRRLIQEVRGA